MTIKQEGAEHDTLLEALGAVHGDDLHQVAVGLQPELGGSAAAGLAPPRRQRTQQELGRGGAGRLLQQFGQVHQIGQAALAIRASEWRHAETTNFIYHYFQSFVAAPVSVEAEFYYRLIAQELGKDTTQWERKSHIFVFESAEDWAQFQRNGALDPWTGGVHSRGELFIRRDPQFRFKGNTLGHEVAHLVVDRFFGANVPLWLNEGYAE